MTALSNALPTLLSLGICISGAGDIHTPFRYFLRCSKVKTRMATLGGIHKLRYTLREAEGVDEVWHCGTRGVWILNFVTSHFKSSINAILHVLVSTKLKQFH